MWSFDVIIKATGERTLWVGRSLKACCERRGLSVADVELLLQSYED